MISEKQLMILIKLSQLNSQFLQASRIQFMTAEESSKVLEKAIEGGALDTGGISKAEALAALREYANNLKQINEKSAGNLGPKPAPSPKNDDNDLNADPGSSFRPH